MKSRVFRALVVCAALFSLVLHRADSVRAVSSGIVISQVYGGGGNAGATWKNDFIELYNLGPTAVNVTGWSVQYAASTGTSWQTTPLSGVIAPGVYYLVQESAGTGGTQNLPTPNAVGTGAGIAMSATAGKVALVTTATAIASGTSCPTGPTVIDIVGFGSGTNCFEGTGPVVAVPAQGNTTAALRKNNGALDSDSNPGDFTVGAPTPRNSPPSTNPAGTMTASVATVTSGDSLTLTVTTSPGTNPTSSGISVQANLTPIGGSATQAFAAAGGNQFTFTTTIPPGLTGGSKTLAATIRDGESRTGTTSVNVTVQTPTPPSAAGTASPASVTAGGTTTLTVTTTAGTLPPSTGITVTADLSSIGGSASQSFQADGGGSFSYAATVDAATGAGPKSLPVTIADAQSRTGSTAIALTVTALSTPPTGAGGANPGTLQAGAASLLTVTVTPGTNPASSGLTVTGNLGAIGGSAAQQFFDDGTNGDATPNDNTFSFLSTVTAGTGAGAKTLPITITDGQSRTGSTSITLTVQGPSLPGMKISQVYGGGGNSGSTFTNDFIELFNPGPTTVDLTLWSVQYHSAGSDANPWQVTPLCQPAQTCTVLPGHYYLVQEAPGAGGTTPLPVADATGTIPLGATAGKVALVADTAPVGGGACPGAGTLLDLVGFGSANCFETKATATLSNTTAAIRKGDGCVDTDNNNVDFSVKGPLPRNSASTPNACSSDPSQLAGSGASNPSSLEVSSQTLLTVRANPATTPPSTNVAVVADLTAIGGAGSQSFFDDGTHGDETPGDNVFSFRATIGDTIATGIKDLVASLSDGEGRTATAHILLTIASPTCGVERWSVKTGTDPDAVHVDLAHTVPATIKDLRDVTPPLTPPDNGRFGLTETTVFVVNGTMTLYKKETDVDYHIVLQDSLGNTMVTEIPFKGCVGPTSPFLAAVTAVRQKFDARLTAGTSFQTANLPVQMTGVGFFDFIHGQTGVAPNGIELHPLLDLAFTAPTTTTLSSNVNPSTFHQTVGITAAVSNGGGPTPTGQVTFLDGGATLGRVDLDAAGHATFNTSSLALGVHTITVSYDGDSASAPSRSQPFSQTVTQADQTVTFDPLTDKTFGDADFTITATASSGLGVTLAVVSGPATIASNTIHLTGTGTVLVRASQTGDANYTAAPPVDRSFAVARASQTIAFTPVGAKSYGDPPFVVTATGGASGNPVTFTAQGTCTAASLDGTATITITAAGSCTLTASQAESANYTAATDAIQTVTISRTKATISVSGYSAPYDGAAHGATGTAVGNDAEDLNSLLTLGEKFTDAPGGTAHWTFAGNTNYLPKSGDVSITIAPTGATVAVSGYTGVYDGHAHGATGTATGVNGENLSSLLNLGAVFSSVPGGTAGWSFAGNADYASSNGTAAVVIGKATPLVGNLTSPIIEAGTASTTLTGRVALGTLIPGGSVAMTLNNVTQAAGLQADGSFAATFATGGLAPAVYPVTYNYGGDANFNAAAGAGSIRVVDTTPPAISGLSASPSVLSPPNHKMIDVTIGYQVSEITTGSVCALSVSSNEALNGQGDGNTSVDWQVLDPHHVQVRSERDGGGSGRIYTITVGCVDTSGNGASRTTTVTVPK